MDNMKHRRLQELDRSDFEIKDGEPDIRGWDVKNSDNEKIGQVEELIVDAQQKKVRYMVVDMDDNDFEVDDKKILVPIGLAELHEKEDDVIIPNINAAQLKSLPEYSSEQLTPEVEQRICSIFGRQTITNTSSSARNDKEDNNVTDDKLKPADPDFYQHEYYHTDNLYKQRLHELEENKKEKKDESEYDKGLRLWEKRSRGGTLEGKRSENESSRSEAGNYSEIDEEARMQMVKSRRENYQSRRYTDEGRTGRGKTIIDRTKEEGLQDG